jgi:hypothetical protein
MPLVPTQATSVQRYALSLFADYCQFYLQDESAVGDLSDAWTPSATERLLAVGPGVVGIRTATAVHVPVDIELLEVSPAEDFAAFDYVVECSLSVQSRAIVAAGCTDYFPDALRIPVESGDYRVRVSYAGLIPERSNQERYRVQCWKAPSTPPYVLKARGP